jgi:alkylation response protein AidB-like acyl-CoA dehydrogenase
MTTDASSLVDDAPPLAALRRRVREFVDTRAFPAILQHEAASSFPFELFRQSGAAGFFRAHLPAAAGGEGLGVPGFCLVSEELARAGAGMIHNGHFQLMEMLLEYATPAQRERFLAPLSQGTAIGAMAITETDVGSSFRGMQTRLEEAGGGWRLNGAKVFINDAAEADLLGVLARSPGGFALVILERETPGFGITGRLDPIGLRSSPIHNIAFQDCPIGSDRILGPPDKGLAVFLSAFNFSRLGNASAALGIAETAFAKALAYCRQRRVGDHLVADFQGLRWKLADMSTRLAAARLLRDHAARATQTRGKSGLLSSQAKLLCVETAQAVVGEALQLTGRYGCLRDSLFDLYLRDVKALAIAGGTLEVMKNNIAREVIGF